MVELYKILIGKFNPILYIQIWENRIKVTNIKTGATYDEKPLVAIEKTKKGQALISAFGNDVSYAASKSNISVVNPFSHLRTLISDFVIGEKLLRHIFQILSDKTVFSPAPKVVIHPMEKIDGGLTMIEERAFKELAMGAGAKEAIIYIGNQLLLTDFNYEAIKKSCELSIK